MPKEGIQEIMNDVFDLVEQARDSGGSEAAFRVVLEKLRSEKKYPLVFEARLMQKRHKLGLPLIQVDDSVEMPKETEKAYQEATVDAAREVGSLFLEDGQISAAWPYFRAIGESAKVAEAIDQIEPQEGIDAIIEIAFYEGANPSKGFELILANYGICRAITTYGQYPGTEGREASAQLLLRTLHGELMTNLKRIVDEHEGSAPQTDSINELINGRDWLFENNGYYVDSSHVASVVQLSLALEDPETLRLALDLADYGKRLSPLFQYQGEPPFENIYEDHAIYLRALLGKDPGTAVAHFRKKIEESPANGGDSVPAQVLVGLLARLERYPDAIEVSSTYLNDIPSGDLMCPSLPQLCQQAGAYEQLGVLSRQQGDLLSYTAAALQVNQPATG